MSESERGPFEELHEVANQPFISAMCEQLIDAARPNALNFGLALEAAIDLLCFYLTDRLVITARKRCHARL
jgi:hypothetical protein